MKLYQHIVNNRPWVYGFGKDSEMREDIKEFIANAERCSGGKFSQREDRCVDNVDFYGTDGSLIHIIDIDSNTFNRNN
jgi:hypothetical protein